MKKITCLLVGLLINSFAVSQVKEDSLTKNKHFFNNNIDYQVKANFSIGGSTPLGMPREIRKIESFNPTLALGLEANATKWFSDKQKWGLRLGVHVEGKGMKTRAKVKNYFTEITHSSETIKGYFTGSVRTYVKNTYVTTPISVVYRLSSRWNLYGGLYLSGLVDQRFDGYVYNGYLRQDTPIRDKLVFSEGDKGTYDFSNEVRKFQWGTQLGAEWYLNRHFLIFSELNFATSPLLKSEFRSITFDLHNLYMNVGFGYQF